MHQPYKQYSGTQLEALDARRCPNPRSKVVETFVYIDSRCSSTMIDR